MLQDSYLAHCKRIYALKALDLMGRNYNQECLGYLHKQLSPAQMKIIMKQVKTFLYAEIKKQDSTSSISVKTEKEEDSKKQKLRKWVKETVSEMEGPKSDYEDWAKEIIKVFKRYPKVFAELKKTLIGFQEKEQKKLFNDSDYKKNLYRLKSIFKFSEKETAVITFLFLDRTDDDVDDYFSGRTINVAKVSKSIRYFCRFFDVSPFEIRELFAKESILIKSGIVTKNRYDSELDLSGAVVGYLCGMSKKSIEDEYVKEANLNEVIRLQDHNVPVDKIHAIKNLLTIEGGCNIILHGHPGTGKTEFAKSIAKDLGKKVYFINQSDPEGEESLDFRKQAIVAAHNIIQTEEAIIVIDECDKVLNVYDGMWKCESSETDDRKAWINDFLENAKHKIIWISNEINGIDESTKRRFSYSIEFSPLTFTQRKKVWETQIIKQRIEFINGPDIEDFAKNLKVNSGGITLGLKDVNGMKDLETKEEKINILRSILIQHESFTNGNKAEVIKKTSKYDMSILNADYPLDKLVNYADQFLKDSSAYNKKGIFNVNLLLQGPPGTGKTEFVKHIADVTEKELMIRRASDIRSKWYGESVRNIAKSFKEAQESNSILFFDEADSFFGSRESSTEYHAEETNEFLTQMENFQGLLICATNFTQKLDQASLRRFNHKIKFDYLNKSGKLAMFRSYFSEILLDDLDLKHLDKLENIPGLTPGDFKVVFQKNILSEKKTAQEILNDLENEISYKQTFSKKVGLSVS